MVPNGVGLKPPISRPRPLSIQVAITRSPLDLHYARIEIDRFLDDDDEPLHKRSRKAIAKATRKDSMRALVKLTEMVDGQRRIVDRPPLIEGLRGRLRDDQLDELRTLFFRYVESLPPHRAAVLERYRVLDVALKVVGVGSVGTRCLIVLLESDQGAPLFLQFKEAVDSVLERHAGPSGWEHAGERVVRGQRAMQAAGDVLLGWASYDEQGGRTVDFYFRQLWDGKGSAEVDQMGPKRLKRYAEVCGRTLALAHARTGDGVAIAGYLGTDRTIDDAIAVFSERYADLDEADHRAHGEAIAAGRVPSQASVPVGEKVTVVPGTGVCTETSMSWQPLMVGGSVSTLEVVDADAMVPRESVAVTLMLLVHGFSVTGIS